MKNTLPFKVYALSNAVVGSVLLFVSLMLGYDAKLVLTIISTSMLLSATGVVALQGILWLMKRTALSPVAAWILLLSTLPILSIVPAVLLVSLVPGNTGVLIGLGLLSSYSGILGHGISITQLFNELLYETK